MAVPARTIIDFLCSSAVGSDAAGCDAARGWHLALAAVLAGPHLERDIDLKRVLEMIVARDVAAFARPRDILDADTARHLDALLLELETGGTSEARMVAALDGLIARIRRVGPVPAGRAKPADRFLDALDREVARRENSPVSHHQ